MVAVMNARKISWNTMYLPWLTAENATAFKASNGLYSSRHGIKKNTNLSVEEEIFHWVRLPIQLEGILLLFSFGSARST